MKKYSIILALVFLLLPGSTVFAQNKQTGVKKEIEAHSEQTDKLVGKKLEQDVLSGRHVEKLDAAATTVKPKPQKKVVHKKRKKH